METNQTGELLKMKNRGAAHLAKPQILPGFAVFMEKIAVASTELPLSALTEVQSKHMS